MTSRRRTFRARLERIAKLIAARPTALDKGLELWIDPLVAVALSQDRRQLDVLLNAPAAAHPTDAERSRHNEDIARFGKRIKDRLHAMQCPDGYGFVEARRDENWVIYESHYKLSLTDIERAQLSAQASVFFATTAEGQARRRIDVLRAKQFSGEGRSTQGDQELDELHDCYPHVPDPGIPLGKSLDAFEVEIEKIRTAEKLRMRSAR
jgi:hypothetical protein